MINPDPKSSEVATAARYSAMAVGLHWLTAAALGLQLVLGWRLGEAAGPDLAALLQWHKSIGISILLLTLIRIGWRARHRPPPPEPGLAPIERRLSAWTHAGFYALLLALPLTGWAMSSAAGGGAWIRLFGVLPWPKLPGQSMLPGKAQDILTDLLADAHAALVWITLALLALHIAGALKHQLVSRDPVMGRMLQGLRPGRLLDGRLIAVPVAAALLIAAAYVPHAPAATPRPKVSRVGSADVYLDVIQPILSRRCESCHTDEQARGGLSVTSYAALMNGGRIGAVVKPGDAAHSELYRRISLPSDHAEVMPKNGRWRLTAEQVAAVHWWIAKGAPSSGLVSSLDPDPQTLTALQIVLKLATPTASGRVHARDDNADLPVVRAASPEAVAGLEADAFVVRRISRDSNLVDVDYSGAAAISPADLDRLRLIGPQILRLNLRDGGLSNASLSILDAMPNLRKLRLEGNPIDDGAIGRIVQRKELRSLNLVRTSVSDAGAGSLAGLPKLHELFAWNSRVSDAGLARWHAGRGR